ncbi:hypothetical protein [Streptomyces sp. NPDC090036]|uniref:hypothetical protein n=1 Tax=Streptomyces sp. NPDC090036 TaxID=3365926 RepID=UPI0037F5A23C
MNRLGFVPQGEITLPEIDLPEVYLPQKRAVLAFLDRPAVLPAAVTAVRHSWAVSSGARAAPSGSCRARTRVRAG